jgi:hypothetical protein
MANPEDLIEWRGGKNHSIGYLKCHSGRSKPLYYVQRNAMDWILDRECARVATGSTMGELQAIAEGEEQKAKASVAKELLHDSVS